MLIKWLCGAAVVIGVSLSVLPARAAYVLTLTQEGADVIANGSGTIDLAGLSFNFNEPGVSSQMIPAMPAILIGGGPGSVDIYGGATGPSNFGSGDVTPASETSGDLVGTLVSEIAVPGGYVSGGQLSSESVWEDATAASLGVTPGVYKWTWGSGATADSFTIDADGLALAAAPVPEASTWIMMLAGFAGLGLGARRLRRSAVSAA
jgi:hypothetical protein